MGRAAAAALLRGGAPAALAAVAVLVGGGGATAVDAAQSIRTTAAAARRAETEPLRRAQAQGPDAQQQAALTPTTAETRAAARRSARTRRDATGAGTTGPANAAAPAAQTNAAAGRDRPGGAHRRPGGPGRRARETGAAESGAASGDAQAEGAAAGATGVSPAASEREHERARRGHGKRVKAHNPEPKSERPPGKKETAPPPTAVVATATPVTPVAVPAAPAAASTQPARPAGAALPTAVPVTPPAQTRAHAGAATLAGAAPAAAPALAAPVAAGAGGDTATDPAAAHRAPAKSAHPHEAGSPIVNTVTRIVDVVPPEIRVLLAALIALALGLGASAAVGALRSRRLARQRRQLLEDVGLMQAALLPPLPERIGPVETSAAYRPSAGPAAGGDFYDVFALSDGRIAVIVGDVSGHGRDALPQTTLVRYTMRTWLQAGHSPRAALQAAAPSLERQLDGVFVTVVLAIYDPRERELVYASAGHPAPLVISGEAVAPAITACSAPPIGCGVHTGTRQTRVRIPGGATVCFYTDGVVEARIGGELYGRERLRDELEGPQSPRDASALLDDVSRACDRRPDDMAACLLRIDGPETAPVVAVEELEIDAQDLREGRVDRFLNAAGVTGPERARALQAAGSELRAPGPALLELHDGPAGAEASVRRQNVMQINQPSRMAARTGGSI